MVPKSQHVIPNRVYVFLGLPLPDSRGGGIVGTFDLIDGTLDSLIQASSSLANDNLLLPKRYKKW